MTDTSVSFLIPKTNKKYFYRKFNGIRDFDLIQKSQDHQKNILMMGPTGSGKTTGCISYSNELQIPYKAVNMNGATTVEEMIGAWTPSDGSDLPTITSKDDFVALAQSLQSKYSWKDGLIPKFIKYSQGHEEVKIVKMTFQDGTVSYDLSDVPSNLLVNIQSNEVPADDVLGTFDVENEGEETREGLLVRGWNRCLVAIEEINFSPVDLMSVWFSVLDARREIVLGEHKGEVLKAGPGLLFVATMNPDYVGTTQLNRALYDRFPIKLNIDYDRRVEASIINLYGKKWGFTALEVLFIKEYIGRIRQFYDNNQLGTNISTRMIEEYIELHGLFGKGLAKESLINSFSEEDRLVAVDAWKLTEKPDEDWTFTEEELQEMSLDEFEGLSDTDRQNLRMDDDPSETNFEEMSEEDIMADPELKAPF